MTALDIRTDARRAIHSQFAIPATYADSIQTVPVPLTVRWHGLSIQAVGDLDGAGYAEVLERVDRLIFNREELDAATLTLQPMGTVTVSALGNSAFSLVSFVPRDGPIEVIWRVKPVGRINP